MTVLLTRWKSLLAFLALIAAIQLLGGLATASSVDNWYPALRKAAWNPPAWVFGPVWTMLYVLIAIAGWRVWIALGDKSRISHPALCAYLVQLGLNLAWSVLFFGLRQPSWALVDIVFLAASIGLCIDRFRTIDRIAAWLLVPYMLWVLYASSLNAAIVVMN